MGRSLPEWHEVHEEAAEVEPDEWAACWEEPLAQPFCLHSVLGLTPSSEGDVASRVRAAFHSRARACYPRENTPDVPSYARQVRRFRKTCLALTVLKDPERRRIYATAGYDGLRRSEAYQEVSAFDQECAALGVFRLLATSAPLTVPSRVLAVRPTSSTGSSRGGRRRTAITCC